MALDERGRGRGCGRGREGDGAWAVFGRVGGEGMRCGGERAERRRVGLGAPGGGLFEGGFCMSAVVGGVRNLKHEKGCVC